MGVRPASPHPVFTSGELIEDDAIVTLAELCSRCGVTAETIVTLVDEGVLEPHGRTRTQWTFAVTSVHRAWTAIRLQRDLDVNLSGVALALELLDRIEALEARLRIDRLR